MRLRGYGYPVEAFAGHGGYQLGQGARLPPLLLDDDECSRSPSDWEAVGGLAIAEIDRASLSALAKLEHLMPVRLRSRARSAWRRRSPPSRPRPETRLRRLR
ncbi:MAG: hypothetical protein R2713_16990 [Ilumatobacteraceae bacterium]